MSDDSDDSNSGDEARGALHDDDDVRLFSFFALLKEMFDFYF